MAAYCVEELGPRSNDDWNRLNLSSEGGSIYHTLEWREILERSFGIRSRYLLIYDDEEPIALCPWFEQSFMRLKGLVLLPESDLSNLINERPWDRDLIRLILTRSMSMAKENKLAFLLTSHRDNGAAKVLFDLSPINGRNIRPFPINGTMSLDLDRFPPDMIWTDLFNKREGQRKYVKRFEKAGFEIADKASRKERDSFYKYYSENLQSIGAEPYESQNFDILFERLPAEMIRMTLLQKEGEIAGGLISLLWPAKKTMYLRYLALNRGLANTYHPPIYLYWEAINHAYQQGYHKVCFGSSPPDPADKTHRIKAGFGCQYEKAVGGLIPLNRIYEALYCSYRASRDAWAALGRTRVKASQGADQK